MAMPTFTMRELIEAGVHFGHKTKRWNPKMAPFIYGARQDIHILDLQQTVPLLAKALQTVRDTVASGGRVLFVGTKRQASEPIAEAAKRCGQFYVNHRWLGGMLTNWDTIQNSIKKLRKLDENLGQEDLKVTKSEKLGMARQKEKLEKSLGGIKDMGGRPDLLFVIDTNQEHIAITEARRLNIPVIAILDSNSDPDGITYPVPGNDDAARAVRMYCQLISDAVLDGIQEELAKSDVDFGASVDLPQEAAVASVEETAEDDSKKGKKAPVVTEKKASRKAAAKSAEQPAA